MGSERLVVKRWYPVGGLYINGERVVTEARRAPGTVLTLPDQTPADVQAEFSSLLADNNRLRRELQERKEPDAA